MIYGIGVDVGSVSRIDAVLSRWGSRFTSRVFTDSEIKFCMGRNTPASAYTLRFAAKEAFSKALGLGMKRGLRWCDIEVFNYPTGQPALRLYGRSLELCQERGINGIHLSLSDEGDYGVAMVVLETCNRDE